MTGPVSRRVAPCGDFPGEVKETPDDRNPRKIRAVSGRLQDEAGERDGVAYAPPPRLTAAGNADRFKVFPDFCALSSPGL